MDRNLDEPMIFAKPPATGVANPCDDCSIVRESDHRIANHLSLLATYVRMKSRDPLMETSGGARLLLQAVGGQIETIGRLHRAMLDSAEPPHLAPHLHAICESFSWVLDGRIRFVEALEDHCQVPLDAILPLTQVATEAIVNAIKHSHPGGEAGAIRVGCRSASDGDIVMDVADDGVGLPAGVDALIGGGVGVKLMRGLALQAGARLAFEDNQPGLRITLRLSAPEGGCRRAATPHTP